MSPPPIYSIVVPTRRRLASLNRALTSLKVQRGVAPAHVELIVADNDERPSARETVAEFARTAPWFVLYVHEPSPGVANVRNAAMARVRGQFVAFLDDDQEACEDWLCEMAAAQKRFHADAVFGLVKGAVPEALGWRKPYLEKFFSRLGPAEAQVVEEPYGCGSSLIRRAAMPDPLAPFNVSRNQIGGEDDMLFDAMKQAGARFAWSPEAWVWEHPDPDRLNLRYAWKRAFAYGQGPTFSAWRRSPPDFPRIVYWMGVGAVQTLVFGAIAALKWAVCAPDRAHAVDRAMRGLGKVLWLPMLKPKFYGLPASTAAGTVAEPHQHFDKNQKSGNHLAVSQLMSD